MANIAFLPEALKEGTSYFLFDDFDWFVTAHRWTSTLAGGSITVASGAAGIAPITPTAANNNDAYLASTNAVFPLAASKPIYAEAKIQFSEADTNAANVAFGLASSVGANLLIDDGGGMRASGTLFAIYKIDGGTQWICTSRNNGVVTINTSNVTAGGAAYQTLSIEILELLGTSCTVTFKVDGVYLRDATTLQIIRHNVLYASFTAMQLFAGVKNGSAVSQVLNVDYMGAAMNR
jgi:hypothetical protein